jgi:hypothetical protein
LQTGGATLINNDFAPEAGDFGGAEMKIAAHHIYQRGLGGQSLDTEYLFAIGITDRKTFNKLTTEPSQIKGFDIDLARDVTVDFIKEKGLANVGGNQCRRGHYHAKDNDNN